MKKVFIAVTAYDSKIDTDCAMSIINNMETLKKNDYDVHLHFETKCCYVPVARNNCVHKFLATDCTDMIFVDNDLGFDRDAMCKLMAADKEIVCGLYPFKLDKEDYPVRLVTKPDGTYAADPYTGLIEIEGGPTGLMRIKREAFESMMIKMPELKLLNGQYTLFDTGNLLGDNQWYGEDYLFCLRWTKLGGKIWAEPNISFSHIGRKMYDGNYMEYVKNSIKG